MDEPKLWYHFRRFAEAVEGIDPPAERFEPAMISNNRFRLYALRGRKTLLVWCRDSQNDWKNELVLGHQPKAVNNLEIDLSSLLTGSHSTRAIVFDPWNNRWQDKSIKSGNVRLDLFQRSVVIRVEYDKAIYGFQLDDIEGSKTDLSAYKGKVLLLVNVASRCGLTKQYAPLQKLYEKYRNKGLVVLGFPANNFGAQEPGTNAQIKNFCTNTFRITFPMFAKISVKGKDIHPLYAYLTGAQTNPGFDGDIKWNFNKFLIGRDGRCIERYDSPVEPLGSQLEKDITLALE